MSPKLFLHGVAGLSLFVAAQTGCWKPNSPGGNPPAHDDHDHGKAGHDDHGHPSEGPHHGQLIELGKEEYHAELIHDDATHKVTIYLLDGAAKKAVAIADKELTVNLVVAGKPQQFQLPAVAQPEDAAGQASRFELTSEPLCEALDEEKTTGRLNLTIAGKPYSGEIKHSDDHDHDHK
ncbi:MAG: hypothetical protein QM775_32740 [Pirellulales bacterium]